MIVFIRMMMVENQKKKKPRFLVEREGKRENSESHLENEKKLDEMKVSFDMTRS